MGKKLERTINLFAFFMLRLLSAQTRRLLPCLWIVGADSEAHYRVLCPVSEPGICDPDIVPQGTPCSLTASDTQPIVSGAYQGHSR